jgi:hypothetical protein
VLRLSGREVLWCSVPEGCVEGSTQAHLQDVQDGPSTGGDEAGTSEDHKGEAGGCLSVASSVSRLTGAALGRTGSTC